MRRLAPPLACCVILALTVATAPAVAKGRAKAPAASNTLVASKSKHTSKLSKKPPTALGSAKKAVASTHTGAKTTSTLPFTGLDIGACVAVGLALLLAGACLRRLTARPT